MSAEIHIDVNTCSVVNFAIQQCKVPVINSLHLRNDGAAHIQGAVLRVSSVPEELCLISDQSLDVIPAHSVVEVKEPKLLLNTKYLLGLPEKITCALRFSVWKEDRELCAQVRQITVLPPNQWHGSGTFPELLAAFETPNHSCIGPVNRRASEILAQRTGDAGMKGYQANKERVQQTAAAIYDAIRELQIAYAVAPASFEQTGQRIRLIHEVLQNKLANCMEMTLFYGACLESAGLHPIFVLQSKHIFIGFWLLDRHFQNAVFDDSASIIKRLDESNQELMLVESTMMCAGKNCDFEHACKIANQTLTTEPMEYCLDVSAARDHGVVPLPIEKDEKNDNTFTIIDKPRSVFKPPVHSQTATDQETPSGHTRQQQWERRLLNLDLRNPLLNLRINRASSLPLVCEDATTLAAALSQGHTFTLCSTENAGADLDFEALARYPILGRTETEAQKLPCLLPEDELIKRCKNLHRQAKTSIEEKGGNTLFLTVGLLRWYDAPSSTTARYAPILLYPIELLISGTTRRVRLREEEIQLNSTLVEKLRQEFSITIDVPDPLPVCDDGSVDINTICTAIRGAIREQKRWDVINSVNIGIFSFSQFVLWRDLHEHPLVLTENKLVSSLLDGHLKWQPVDERFAAGKPEQTLMLPIEADGSQMFAIESACKGETFIIDGPPGTGKSQTITAIIATAIAQGRKVLFVTEKLAGLNVVRKRLEELGLAPFCLELHSNKSRMQDVLRHLEGILELAALHDDDHADIDSQKYLQIKDNLDRYAHALHRKGQYGISLYDLVTRYEQLEEGMEFGPALLPDARTLDREAFANLEELLQQVTFMAEALGDPSAHALRHIHADTYSQQLRDQLNYAVSSYRNALMQTASAADLFAQRCQLPPAKTQMDLATYSELSRQLSQWKQLPSAWNTESDLEQKLQSLEKLASLCITTNALRDQLLQDWKKEFLRLDGAKLYKEYEKGTAGPAVLNHLCYLRFNKLLSPLQTVGIPGHALGPHLLRLAQYRSGVIEAREMMAKQDSFLRASFGVAPYQWEKILNTVHSAQRISKRIQVLTDTENNAFRHRYAPNAVDSGMEAQWKSLKSKRDNLYNLLGLDAPLCGDHGIEAELESCQRITEQIDSLKNWTAWNALCRKATHAGLCTAVDACVSGNDPAKIRNGYRRSMYRKLINHMIDSDPALSSFTGLIFNEQISNLNRLDKQLQEQSRQRIRSALTQRIRSTVDAAKTKDANLSTLRKAISSGGRGTTVRKLFAQMTDLIFELCPCMLMSPTSVAQYLPMCNDLVDLVIFDEASQIPTCKAVGALARGSSAIIVGDKNQMPPTSFFCANNLDEENLDTEDLESILDDCLSLDMPQTHLLWHYRSRHESLIAFSNNRFYGNKLLTFPSASDRSSHVRLELVKGGVFDRGKSRQNPVEAQAVVDALRVHCRDAQKRELSVGIITFNIEQQCLIEDLLQKACVEDKILREWCENAPERLFVKNLENVQGDERDVIMFSVGFGPDSSGKLSMNFGPLNREGGWRRLNVAISRARCFMTVFCSILPEQIDLSRTRSRGLRELRYFLEYASGCPLTMNADSAKKIRNSAGIAQQICHELRLAGYETVCNVGHSDLQVDIAVVHPKHQHQYVLGILLDGGSYASAKTTRDRELSQVQALQNLGWNMYRIWTVDWWDNRRKQMLDLIHKLQTLC